ncbi:MAG: MerR family transcriptional regulator [bacterium]
MELRVGSLAEAAGIGVDTVRFYQSRGLIPAPMRRGRFAIYDERHLERIRRIRSLLDAGFSLSQIQQLLDSTEADDLDDPGRERARSSATRSAAGTEGGRGRDRRASTTGMPAEHRGLLDALAARSVGEGTLSRAELAEETGVPEPLILAAVRAGLLQPVEIRGQERFPRSDLEMTRAALELLRVGLPLDRLLELAAEHAAHVDRLADRAIDLFDDSIRKPRGEDDESVRRAFESLLPRATEIVALHFQRTLVARALARLRTRGEEHALEKALEATQAARLEVQWR